VDPQLLHISFMFSSSLSDVPLSLRRPEASGYTHKLLSSFISGRHNEGYDDAPEDAFSMTLTDPHTFVDTHDTSRSLAGSEY
jgi:hypothetical protein